MTDEQVMLVRTSWASVEPISDTAAALFYGRLFETTPAVQPLFTGDMEEQGRKLMQMIGVVVAGLDKLDRIVPAVEALGRRHGSYGVEPAHYDAVGAAVLWTLEQGLGEAFSPAVAEAWAEAYGLLADVMISAGEAPAGSAPQVA
jgi:hemoglobin-like flavoprotein